MEDPLSELELIGDVSPTLCPSHLLVCVLTAGADLGVLTAGADRDDMPPSNGRGPAYPPLPRLNKHCCTAQDCLFFCKNVATAHTDDLYDPFPLRDLDI